MTPGDRRFASERKRRTQSAIARLKTNPGFARSQVQLMDRFEKVKTAHEAQLSTRATTERMEYALRVFDIQAEAYLMLVSDMKSQDDFITLLGEFGFRAWEEYTEFPITVMPPIPPDRFRPIRERVRHWTTKGFRRLESLRSSDTEADHGNKSRQGIGGQIKVLREECRMTIEQLAEEVGITSRSVERHESGASDIRANNLQAYEETFSKRLKRHIRLG
jgi:DNA-binding XRE family transcriptional regulator